jgi:HNH/ENDO VII superfamily nuclease
MRALGFNAHHIVAVKDSRAAFARMVLHQRGIGPNSPANGVWLKKSMHTPIHTNAYYANVNAVTAKYFFNHRARHPR